MQTRIYATVALLLTVFTAVQAQKLKVDLNLNVGMCRLYHNTNFETTKMNGLYKFVEISHPEGYTWEQFAETYQLREKYEQPHFGVSARFRYKDWPLILEAQAMSSPSGYEKMAYGGLVGLGKDLPIGDNIGLYFSFLGGYKFVYDKGFGANTLTNSIGHKTAREYASEWFDPKKPLGTQKGNLFTLHLSLAKSLDEAETLLAGAEVYGELDLTDKVAREGAARMTNAGVHVFLRFSLFQKKEDPFYPSPGGH
ncbi:MAG TPA: hypothetical protein PKL15_11815 [Saprospiraceae bacterium]|nr:hypothetical protein [Saprospiraceae bacterium]